MFYFIVSNFYCYLHSPIGLMGAPPIDSLDNIVRKASMYAAKRKGKAVLVNDMKEALIASKKQKLEENNTSSMNKDVGVSDITTRRYLVTASIHPRCDLSLSTKKLSIKPESRFIAENSI